MKFINIILDNSALKESKLISAAQKAFDKPDTGITIQHKGAYNVIKDCANVTLKYLPHYIFGAYANPFHTLNGKFKKTEVEEFVKKSRDDYALGQLLTIVLKKIESEKIVLTPSIKEDNFDVDSTDPYGLYGSDIEVANISNTSLSDVDIICFAFGVV
jgi:hypothetical protein